MTTDPSSTQTEAAPTAPTVTSSQAPQVSPRTPKFQVLSTFYLAHLDHEFRREIYNEVLTAVKKGSLPGMVHRGNLITLDMSNSRLTGANSARLIKLEEILLKNLPDLQARLDALSDVVSLRHVIDSAGKGVTADELMEMGDGLDFDRMVATAQKKRKQNARTGAKRRIKPAS